MPCGKANAYSFDFNLALQQAPKRQAIPIIAGFFIISKELLCL